MRTSADFEVQGDTGRYLQTVWALTASDTKRRVVSSTVVLEVLRLLLPVVETRVNRATVPVIED
jgi:hypothetical protein